MYSLSLKRVAHHCKHPNPFEEIWSQFATLLESLISFETGHSPLVLKKNLASLQNRKSMKAKMKLTVIFNPAGDCFLFNLDVHIQENSVWVSSRDDLILCFSTGPVKWAKFFQSVKQI